MENGLKNKKILYDHSVDQIGNKLSGSKTLKKIDLTQMPDYIRNNYKKYFVALNLEKLILD